MPSDPQPTRFSADSAIRSKSEDLLGRARFAQSLAEVVEGWTGNASLVMALYGPWGIGKSSIKNMMLEHLRQKATKAPQVVEFNPWQWAAQDELAKAFFREISLALGKKDQSKEAKKRAIKVAAYAAYLKLGTHLLDGVRPLISTVLFFAGILGIGAAYFQNVPRLKPYIGFGGAALLVLAGLTQWLSGFAEKLTSIFSSQEALLNKDLNETKSEVANLLKRLDAPILVVIDDVDRLTAEEVRLTFQLIKANADFPNVVYLILCQRDIIELSLEKITTGTGRDFLEKIVQVPFDVPKVEQTKLQRVLFTRLDEALANPAFERNFNRYRWTNLFLQGLAPYFDTLRDVYRFLSVLEVQLARLTSRKSLEVNPIDLIALEVLRVFEPDVYHLIPKQKERLTKREDVGFGANLTERERKERERLEPLTQAAQAARKDAVVAILNELFPKITVGNLDRLYRELRVCHEDVFDRYFQLSIPEGDVSQADLDQLLSSTHDRIQLVGQFEEFKSNGLLATVLDRLESYKQEVKISDSVPFITALFDIGDDLPEADGGMFVLATWMHASRIIRWHLLKEPDVARRYHYLQEAMNSSEGLFLPAMKIAMEADAQKEGRPESDRILDEGSLKTLKELSVEKIRNCAAAGKLANHRHRGTLLGIWAEWGELREPKAFVEKLIQSSEGLLSFLESLTNKSTAYSSGDYGPRESWYMQLEVLERFVDAKMVQDQIEKLESQAQNESQARAVRAFEEALERRRAGKPSGRPFFD